MMADWTVYVAVEVLAMKTAVMSVTWMGDGLAAYLVAWSGDEVVAWQAETTDTLMALMKVFVKAAWKVDTMDFVKVFYSAACLASSMADVQVAWSDSLQVVLMESDQVVYLDDIQVEMLVDTKVYPPAEQQDLKVGQMVALKAVEKELEKAASKDACSVEVQAYQLELWLVDMQAVYMVAKQADRQGNVQAGWKVS